MGCRLASADLLLLVLPHSRSCPYRQERHRVPVGLHIAQRERERERDRQTDRQRQRDREREKERQRQRELVDELALLRHPVCVCVCVRVCVRACVRVCVCV